MMLPSESLVPADLQWVTNDGGAHLSLQHQLLLLLLLFRERERERERDSVCV